jgi:nitric oxide reductase large subunit
LLFGALVVVIFGSLLGELVGVKQLLGNLWFWFGDQGWAYLDLGRAWQIILALGLVFWLILLRRAVAPAFECVNFAKSHASSVRRVSGTTSIAEKTAARAIVMLDWPVQYQ